MTDFAAAWYPHPSRPGMLRYYDGTEWTDSIAIEGSDQIGSEAEFLAVERWRPTQHHEEVEPASGHTPSSLDHLPVALGGRPLVGSDQQRGQIVCQFCQEQGCVTARKVPRVKRKTATRIVGGIATMGGSLALTGVSKKGVVIELSCSNCGMSWDV